MTLEFLRSAFLLITEAPAEVGSFTLLNLSFILWDILADVILVN
jgi:hypothetical protein